MFRIPGYVAALLVPATVLAASLADISNRDAVNGLKEALVRGGQAAVARLGVENGFFRNDRVKIPLPPSLRRVEAVMRSIGMDRHADELVLRMNRAAEAAVPEAKTLLADAVKKMSVQDAKGILTGGDDAATQYFKRTTSEPLAKRFRPIVKKAMEKVKLAEKYDEIAASGAKFGLVKEEDAQLEDYVTRKALDAGIARNVVKRRAGHVRHLTHARVRQQRLARVVVVLVAYQAQLHDRELRGDRTPQDAVIEDRERRGGRALLHRVDISSRNERTNDRRHTGFRSGGDQADKNLLEFIGGRGQTVESLSNRLRAALQQSARLDRPSAVDADHDVRDFRRDCPHATWPQHLGRLENSELPGITGPRDECALGLPLSEIDVLQRVSEQYKVPNNVGRALFFLKGIRCHVVLLWTG